MWLHQERWQTFMKRQLIPILTLFLICHTSYSQTHSQVVDDEIIHELIIHEIDNSPKNRSDKIFGKKRINSRQILWSEAIISILSENSIDTFEFQFEALVQRDRNIKSEFKKIDELFDSEDITYLREQFENEIVNSWNFKAKKVTIKKNPRNNFYSYSIPLFDKEFQTAIIYKEFYCGSLCAYGTVEVYQKNNGKWKHYKSISLWIS